MISAEKDVFSRWATWALKGAKTLQIVPSKPSNSTSTTTDTIDLLPIDVVVEKTGIKQKISQPQDFMWISSAPCQYIFDGNWYILPSFADFQTPRLYQT